MITRIQGNVSSIFPDDINTDDIIPAWTLQESSDRSYFAPHAFSNYDQEFVTRCAKKKDNIIVAGRNFGCGSSREQAVYALTGNGVVAVIAQGFPDIFYRNSLNNSLPLIILKDTSIFKISDKIQIDLQKREILINNTRKIKFVMSEQDAKTFVLGGKIGRVRTHLTEVLDAKLKKSLSKAIQTGGTNEVSQSEASQLILQTRSLRERTGATALKQRLGNLSDRTRIKRGKTIIEKIISDHIGRDVYAGEKLERLPIDVLFFNEVIGPPSIKDFLHDFKDIFKKYNIPPKVFDPKRVFLIPDHTVPSSSVAVSQGIDLMEEFARTQGMKCYKEGDGIEHVVLIEDGYIVPGAIILGTDSHTDTNGALNTLAFGVGTTDATYALATGSLYDFEVPETIRVNLKGRFQKGVYSKDLILSLIGKVGVGGAVHKIIEFGGPALKNLSMDARTTIANMVVEMGARTGVFEYDSILESYVKDRAKLAYRAYLPDTQSRYARIISIDLSSLEPSVAFPHKPGNITGVSHLSQFMKLSQKSKTMDFAPVHSLRITDAFLGACTNGRYEDFLAAAKVLKGRKVHPDVTFVAIPASRTVYNRLMKEGILQIFAESGANIESSNCGPCFGKHMGVVGRGAQMISSSNRNYIGRMGSRDARIFLASPVTVAAAAVAGEIVDPRRYL